MDNYKKFSDFLFLVGFCFAPPDCWITINYFDLILKAFQGQEKSLNTGLVSIINYNKEVPSAVSHVTFAHEVGHNFGSQVTVL